MPATPAPPPGEHEIELYLDGYESTRQTLYPAPGKAYRIRHQMQPLKDGARQPPRPEPVAPLPTGGSPAPEFTIWKSLGTVTVPIAPM